MILALVLLACHPTIPLGSRADPSGDDSAPLDSDPLDVVPPDTGPTWTPCVDPPPAVLNELVASNQHGLTDADGDTSDWIELALPAGAAAVDLTGWSLSQNGAPDATGWALPAQNLEAGTTLFVWASSKNRTTPELATDFGIDTLGDIVFLQMPDGCVADHVDTPRLYADVSYGRPADAQGAGSWEYFLEPTPGATNSTESRPAFADPPTLSPAGGFMAEAVVQAAGPTNSTLRYTLDGAPPDETSPTFPASPGLDLDAVDQPVVVRARSFVDGLWPSRMTTQTYFEDVTLAEQGVRIISLTADPPDLFDPVTGMYMPGPGAELDYPYFGANFWEPWERDVHIEMYAPGGERMLDQDAGIQIAGGYSRAFDQRNFEIISGTGYGPEDFTAKVFDNEGIESFHRLYLRNGGDWCSTQLVDGAVQAVFRDDNGVQNPALDMQAYEPALVYINGEFWGLYELKERLDEFYIESHHGADTPPADKEKLDRVKLGWTHEANWTLEQGSWDAFDALNAMTTQDFTQESVYDEFKARVDVDNFIANAVTQGWIGNTDWWINNIRMWRPNDADEDPDAPDGRFRWMGYDYGHGWPDYTYDHLATTVNGDWAGLPIGSALLDPEFRIRFINIHGDFLNTSLSPEVASARVEALAAETRPVMAMQRERWCGGANMAAWESAVSYAATFAERRPRYMDQTLRANLRIPGNAALSLKAEGAGTFHLAVVSVTPPWEGAYYLYVPVTVSAIPAEGWVFEAWEGSGTVSPEDPATITVPMAEDTVLTAVFVPE